MSNTEGYTARKTYDPRTIRRIATRAKNIIQKSIEQNATVKLMADVVIDDFVDLVGQLTGTPPLALVSKARAVSAPVGIKPTKEHAAGGDLGELTLKLSFDVEQNKLSFNEARQQLNRKIRERINNDKRERAAQRDVHTLKPSIPTHVDTNRWGGTKRSPKQPYRHANKAQGRRKAA